MKRKFNDRGQFNYWVSGFCAAAAFVFLLTNNFFLGFLGIVAALTNLLLGITFEY